MGPATVSQLLSPWCVCVCVRETPLQNKVQQESETVVLIVVRPSVLRYFFPTYENDALLCTLSDSDEDQREETNRGEDVPVIAEDVSNLRELQQTSVLKQLLKNRSSCS